jgi:hypothetical protein
MRPARAFSANSAASCVIPELEGLPFPAPLKILPWPDLRALFVETLEAASTPVIVSKEINIRNRTYMVMLMGAGIDMVIADPFDKDLMEWIRVVEERDESTSLNKLLVKLHDRVEAMEELQPEDVDMSDPQQADIWKTVQILLNKVIYTDSYLRL